MRYSSEDVWVTGQTAWGEARNQGPEGIAAVLHVLRNRSLKSGRSPAKEARKPYQFSAWNVGDPNRVKMLQLTLDDPIFCQCLHLAIDVLSGAHADTTHGARHFHRADLAPLPAWAVGHAPCVTIGHHVFYNDIS